MKAPNFVSIISILGVMLPAVITVITQQFPPEMYWWSAFVVTVITSAFTAFQAFAKTQEPEPPPMPEGVMGAPAPSVKPAKMSKMKLFLVG